MRAAFDLWRRCFAFGRGLLAMGIAVSAVAFLSPMEVLAQTTPDEAPAYNLRGTPYVTPRAPKGPVDDWFEWDPKWPQMPLPGGQVMQQVTGVAADDAMGLIWVVHHSWLNKKPDAYNPSDKSILAFDRTGKLVHAWGGPGPGYDWPGAEHGISVDHKGNVWVGGQAGLYIMRSIGVPRPWDGQILKFTREGRFLLQIGGPGPGHDNTDIKRLAGAAGMVVDPTTNEVFVADGYENNRIIVFDADTGKYKRMWGAFGKKPMRPTEDDLKHAADGQSKAFRNLHCLKQAKDGLLYVCDRGNNRIQVFKRDGTYVTQFMAAISDIGFSPDPQQSMLVIGGPDGMRVLNRSDGKLIGDYGSRGIFGGQISGPHLHAVDGAGTIYTGEIIPGQRLGRVQRFTGKSGGPFSLPAN